MSQEKKGKGKGKRKGGGGAAVQKNQTVASSKTTNKGQSKARGRGQGRRKNVIVGRDRRGDLRRTTEMAAETDNNQQYRKRMALTVNGSHHTANEGKVVQSTNNGIPQSFVNSHGYFEAQRQKYRKVASAPKWSSDYLSTRASNESSAKPDINTTEASGKTGGKRRKNPMKLLRSLGMPGDDVVAKITSQLPPKAEMA